MFFNLSVMVKKFYFGLMMIMMSVCAHASIVINELMPKNVTYKVDDTYQFSGWAELYNNGAEDVDISLYFFSDSLPMPTKWQMNKNVILKPGEYAVVYFDSNEENAPLHANFKLPAKKGCLYLSDEKGSIIDKMAYDTTYRNISYGRIVDGGDKYGYFLKATPNATNASNSVATGKTAAPQFNLTPGFYQGNQNVEISAADKSAKIYYTTNGDEPTTKSNLYTGSISISQNTPLRAIAVKEGEMSSDVTTGTYFINETVNKLPIVSIVSDSLLLYGDTLGLLVAGINGKELVRPGCNGPDRYANYWNDWDRPCNFELFDPGKTERLNQEVKIGNFGACSRTKYIKSIKVNAGKVYGAKELNYSIFSEKPNLQWKSVVLRNSGNDYGRSYLRDGFMQTLLIGQLDIDHQAYQPSMVFINGSFYGMLNIRERTNKDFIWSNYGLDEDEFYINEGKHANEPDSKYNELLILAEHIENLKSAAEKDRVNRQAKLDSINKAENPDNTKEYDQEYLEKLKSEARQDSINRQVKLDSINNQWTYDQIDRRIDINEFLNYFMAEIYYNNTDWPGGNIKCWKKKGTDAQKTDGKWRWILYDTDFGYSLYGANYSSNGMTTASDHPLFSAYIENELVKEKFLAKNCVHLATTFNPDRAKHILDSLVNNIKPDVDRYIKKISSVGKIEANFESDINSMKTFAEKRPKTLFRRIAKYFDRDTLPIRIYSDLASAKFSINEEPIKISDFNSYFFTNTNYRIKAIEPKGYRFDHWEISIGDSAYTSENIVCTGTFKGEKFKAVYVEDKNYNPSSRHLYINEICTSNSIFVDEFREQDDWFEIYNAGDSEYDLSGLYLSINKDTLGKFKIPNSSAAIIPANGYKLFWADKDPEQGPLHTNFKLPASKENTLYLSYVTVNGSDSTFVIIDSVRYTHINENESYIRMGEYYAPEWKVTGIPTPEKQNIYAVILDNPIISVGDATIKVYPNPTSDKLFVSFPWDKEISATITSITGVMLKKVSVSSNEGIDVNALPEGIYLLKLSTPNGEKTVRILKK